MAHIHSIPPASAEGALAEIYAAIGSARQGVAAVHRSQSLNPRALRAHLELYKAVVFARSPLSRLQRERIGVVVSAANQCAYCVQHHAEALRQLGDFPAVVSSLSKGELAAVGDAAERALLAWAVKGAQAPAACEGEDVATLRDAGWSDRALLDACLVVAYFAFVNRLVLMLGVDIEEGFERLCS